MQSALLDLVGSALLLLALSPILLVIAIAIKLTSDGPVFFGQERLGQFGTRFKCLKFRTMYTNNDPKIHREYVERFIAGKAKEERNESGSVVYKIMDDPRITPVGRLLRNLSFDEFPQFWNVLRGEMSLVGPRPTGGLRIPRCTISGTGRRVLEVKPGVTGLWQVSGRSRTSFDDMVRLDLRYSQSWSLWLDLKILAATPRASLREMGRIERLESAKLNWALPCLRDSFIHKKQPPRFAWPRTAERIIEREMSLSTLVSLRQRGTCRGSMIRFGVIGYGYWGPNIVRNLHGLDSTRVTMVSDKSPRLWPACGRLIRRFKRFPILMEFCVRRTSTRWR